MLFSTSVHCSILRKLNPRVIFRAFRARLFQAIKTLFLNVSLMSSVGAFASLQNINIYAFSLLLALVQLIVLHLCLLLLSCFFIYVSLHFFYCFQCHLCFRLLLSQCRFIALLSFNSFNAFFIVFLLSMLSLFIAFVSSMLEQFLQGFQVRETLGMVLSLMFRIRVEVDDGC